MAISTNEAGREQIDINAITKEWKNYWTNPGLSEITLILDRFEFSALQRIAFSTSEKYNLIYSKSLRPEYSH